MDPTPAPVTPASPPARVFRAVAFVENLSLKELAAAYPEAKRSPHQLSFAAHGGEVFIYPFGAIVFRDLPPAAQQAELGRLRRARAGLTETTVIEELAVREDPGRAPVVADGVLTLDRATPGRASIVALTVAQSAAMEYYERIVEEMFTRTDRLVDRIYAELRAEFDLTDRYQALELKLRSVQEALELVLDVARDRRLVLLEGAVVLLIVLEIVLAIFRR